MSKPLTSIIAAIAKQNALGKNNQLIWHLPADLKRFKQVTSNHHVIMGRKTYESIGRPLPGRKNIVLSRDKNYFLEGCETVSSLEEALLLVSDVEEVMIIGGGFLYEQTISFADKLYLTFIDLDVDGDTLFPEFEKLNLKEIKREKHLKDEKNPYDYEFVDFRILKN